MAAKPFLKWAGGKGQLIDQLTHLLPAKLKDGSIAQYCEPFIGGGAVFFHIAARYPIRSAYLSDLNPDLVVAYLTIKQDVEGVIGELRQLATHYAALSVANQKVYFYEMRDSFNHDRLDFNYKAFSGRWLRRTAWLLFLNRTCFNGLYRVNKSGEFNVPFGKYQNPRILDEDNLRHASKLLAIAEIHHADFAQVLEHTCGSAFIYFDPPYRPLNKTSSFTSYSTCEFDDTEQRRLAGVIDRLCQSGYLVMLSNSDPKNINTDDDFFDDLYKKHWVQRVSCRRAINSKAEARGEIKEIVVTNYPPTRSISIHPHEKQHNLFEAR